MKKIYIWLLLALVFIPISAISLRVQIKLASIDTNDDSSQCGRTLRHQFNTNNNGKTKKYG